MPYFDKRLFSSSRFLLSFSLHFYPFNDDLVIESRKLSFLPNVYSLQAFSSEPSVQSAFPLQNNSLSMHSPFPQASFPVSQMGSSVARRGVASLGSVY